MKKFFLKNIIFPKSKEKSTNLLVKIFMQVVIYFSDFFFGLLQRKQLFFFSTWAVTLKWFRAVGSGDARGATAPPILLDMRKKSSI